MASMYIDVDSASYQPGETMCGTLHVMVRAPSVRSSCIHLVLKATETATIRDELSAKKTKKCENGLYPKVKYTENALYLQEVKVLLGSMEGKRTSEVLTRGHYQYPFRLRISENAPPSYYCSMPTGTSSKLQHTLTATLVVEGQVNPQTSTTVHIAGTVRAESVAKARDIISRNLAKDSIKLAKGGSVTVSVDMQPWIAVLEKYESEALTREDTMSSVRSSIPSSPTGSASKDQIPNNAVIAHVTITNNSKAPLKEVHVVARQRQCITLNNATCTTQYVASLEKPTPSEVAAAKNNSFAGEQAMEAVEAVEADAELLPDEECTNTTLEVTPFRQEASMETRIAFVTLTDLPDDGIKPGQTVTLSARLKLPRETRTTYVQHKGVPLPSISTAFLQTATLLEVSFPGVELKGAPYVAEKPFFVASAVDPHNRVIDIPAKFAAAQKY